MKILKVNCNLILLVVNILHASSTNVQEEQVDLIYFSFKDTSFTDFEVNFRNNEIMNIERFRISLAYESFFNIFNMAFFISELKNNEIFREKLRVIKNKIDRDLLQEETSDGETNVCDVVESFERATFNSLNKMLNTIYCSDTPVKVSVNNGVVRVCVSRVFLQLLDMNIEIGDEFNRAQNDDGLPMEYSDTDSSSHFTDSGLSMGYDVFEVYNELNGLFEDCEKILFNSLSDHRRITFMESSLSVEAREKLAKLVFSKIKHTFFYL